MRWFQRFLHLLAVVLLSACVFSVCGCAQEEGVGGFESGANLSDEELLPDSAANQEGNE